MKTVSLRLSDAIFIETDKVVSMIDKPRNKYINEALAYYNKIQNRAMLAKKMERESNLVKSESMHVLAEFESLNDND